MNPTGPMKHTSPRYLDQSTSCMAEGDQQEEEETGKGWTQKDAKAKHTLLGEIQQYNEVLEHLSEIDEDEMETEEEDGGGGPVEKIDVDEDKNTPKAADEVDTTTVVKTPEAAEGSGEHHQEGDKMEDEDIHRQEEIEEEEMEHADDEGADGLEERANKEEKLNIPKEADEVDMTIVVKTPEAAEGSGEHHCGYHSNKHKGGRWEVGEVSLLSDKASHI